MELINRWLKGSKNYIIGRNLYKLYGKDVALKHLFHGVETQFSRQRMLEALTEINVSGERSLPPSGITADAPPAAGNVDTVQQSLNVSWKDKYKRMQTLRGAVLAFGTRNDLEAVTACQIHCAEILSLEQEIMGIHAANDHYTVTGTLPHAKVDEFVIPSDPMALATLIGNLKKYIRRYKQKLRLDPPNAEYAALLQKYESQLKQIDDAAKKKD